MCLVLDLKMKPIRFHSWNISPDEAFAIQMNLRDKVVVRPLPDEIRLVAGTAVSHDPNTNSIHAALVILRFPDMELVERHGLSEEIIFPYVRGILAFREAPTIMKLMKRIQHIPDVILFHSHGLLKHLKNLVLLFAHGLINVLEKNSVLVLALLSQNGCHG